jgi:hypothetical protein
MENPRVFCLKYKKETIDSQIKNHQCGPYYCGAFPKFQGPSSNSKEK